MTRTGLFFRRTLALALFSVAAFGQAPGGFAGPQSSSAPPSSLSASVLNTRADLRFEVASIKPSDPKGGRGRSNVPLSAGERYTPNDGYFSASGQPLERYIAFAFDMDPNPDPQLKTLPDWVNSERYDIEARASHPVTKDEMRAMMRNLLVDRFKMTTHFEVRNLPVYKLTVVKPGKFGPQMRQHVDEGVSCEANPPAAAARGAAMPNPAGSTVAPPAAPSSVSGANGAGGGRRGQAATPDGYPAGCGELMSLTASMPGRWRLGGRNITMDFFVVTLRGGMDRPVIDETGLTGRYDWVMEYVPNAETDGQVGANFSNNQGDPNGPGMWTALPEQLGLKLTPTKMDVQFLVFDHIERPSGN